MLELIEQFQTTIAFSPCHSSLPNTYNQFQLPELRQYRIFRIDNFNPELKFQAVVNSENNTQASYYTVAWNDILELVQVKKSIDEHYFH